MPGLKVLIKGMNKVIEFPTDTPMEVIEQSIKGGWNEIESISGLPMDTASRMERAKYLGFDPDDITFSGGSEQVEKIRGGELFNGIFGSHDENVAESFGEVTELLVRPNKLLSHSELNTVFIHPDGLAEVPLNENIGIYAWHCEHHYEHINQLMIRKGWKK